MMQLIFALGIVAALVYFVLFRTGGDTAAGDPAKPYAAEVQKAEQVEQVLQQGREQRLAEELRQEQELQQQRIDESSQ